MNINEYFHLLWSLEKKQFEILSESNILNPPTCFPISRNNKKISHVDCLHIEDPHMFNRWVMDESHWNMNINGCISYFLFI
jgi:hypothetical protein